MMFQKTGSGIYGVYQMVNATDEQLVKICSTIEEANKEANSIWKIIPNKDSIQSDSDNPFCKFCCGNYGEFSIYLYVKELAVFDMNLRQLRNLANLNKIDPLQEKKDLKQQLYDIFQERIGQKTNKLPHRGYPEMVCMNCDEKAKTKCSKCHMTFYCSQNCQKEDWPSHKILCQKFVDAKTKEKDDLRNKKDKTDGEIFQLEMDDLEKSTGKEALFLSRARYGDKIDALRNLDFILVPPKVKRMYKDMDNFLYCDLMGLSPAQMRTSHPPYYILVKGFKMKIKEIKELQNDKKEVFNHLIPLTVVFAQDYRSWFEDNEDSSSVSFIMNQLVHYWKMIFVEKEEDLGIKKGDFQKIKKLLNSMKKEVDHIYEDHDYKWFE